MRIATIMQRRVLTLVMLAGLLAAGPACQNVPITGRRQISLVPNSMVLNMSFQQYDEFLAQAKLSEDEEARAMVDRVGRRISQSVEKYAASHGMRLEGYQWEFNLVEDESVNAWAMPGGKVVVHTGLLPVAQDETGLAVVMGHEIAHAVAQHGHERMSQMLLAELGGQALQVAMAQQPQRTHELFMSAYGLGAQVGVLLPYGRLHETEADRLGLIFMAMGGYDPRTAPAFWERMSAMRVGGEPPEILSTHPSDTTRIEQIHAFMPEAMSYYQPGPN